ncbi:serine hydrolase domain-containing protein [Pukyongiella litopenaei]|nr:serine hydrolase [Pukyongiella litopenaei]
MSTPVSPPKPKTARDLGIMQGFPPPPEKRPTLENWDLPPFNRWSFQNVRSLFPTAEVWRGTGPADPFGEDLQSLDGIQVVTLEGDRVRLADFLAATYADGFLVCHRDRIVYERYFNDMGPETPHLSQSVAKSLVGLVAGVLDGQGLLEMHAPLADLVPELAACGYARATLAQALDMQTGVRFTEDYNLPGSDMTRIDIASGWRPGPETGERPTIRDVILTLPAIRPHGERFDYRSIETDLVAWVLERAAGRSLAELVSTLIWQPVGAERDAYFTVDAAGTALADGGFNATLRDYARLGRLVLKDGRAMGRQVVPRDWIDGMRRGETAKFGEPYSLLTPNGAYRRFWWVRDNDRGDISARGVFGQMIHADPEADLLVVKLSTWPDYLIPAYTANTYRAIDAIRVALGA